MNPIRLATAISLHINKVGVRQSELWKIMDWLDGFERLPTKPIGDLAAEFQGSVGKAKSP